MKGYWKLVAVLLALVFGAVSSGSAIAQRSSRGVGSRPIGASHPGGGYSHVRGYGHVASHGYRYGYGWAGGPRWGLAIGAPLFWPGYYGGYYPYPYPYAYPYAYPAPVYDTPWPAAPSGAYVEQEVPQAPSQAPAPAQGDWYYCADSNAYYPYVRECPAGWQRVPSIPPR